MAYDYNKLNKTSRTFLPDILAPGTGLSPLTERSIIPTNNVVTIQDILNGYKYKLPGGGGDWSEGEDISKAYMTEGDAYKRLERDFDVIKKILGNGVSSSEEWTVVVPGGKKTFPSLQLAQEYGKRLSDNGVPVKSIKRTKTAQVSKPIDIASTIMNKTYKVLYVNLVNSTESNGSAFCIGDGYFMTCAHVIQKYNKSNGEKININKAQKEGETHLINNDKKYPASIVFINEALDIAILRSAAPSVFFEFEKNMKIGDDIIVVGSPHGFEGNVTFGKVSSLNRIIYKHKGAPRYIFIDAHVFSGNSGGPVINANNGKVIGMVTAIAAANGEYGLNAAIPSYYLEKIKNELNIRSTRKAFSINKVKTAQNFSGYYSGEVPDYAANLIGTSNVDATQVKGVFPKADEAIKLVNQFDSSLLLNISFIFNFSNAGAYGVYLSELDNAIKTKALQKRLESMGYKVEEENGMPVAIPTKEEKTQEQIKSEIKKIYDELNKGGGTAIGVNVSRVLSSSKENALALKTSEPDFVYEQLAILHLGETIVHEAVHAKGSHSEGPSEAAEAKFAQWALPKINENYKKFLQGKQKENEFSPLIVKSAKSIETNFYKVAQSMFGAFDLKGVGPTGSDLKGRAGFNGNYGQGRADYSRAITYNPHASLESMLNRDFAWPLAKDIDPDKDSIEEQLRKTDKNTYQRNPNSSFDELLQKDYVESDNEYKSIEERLQEKRPAPLMQTLKAASNKMIKEATLFGYFNNLAVSDGSTFPGLSDRVMAWDDRDELFAQEEDWIRKQPRYNPEYDIKGFYYRWIEPQFTPRLFDDPSEQLSNIHPARRFAGTNSESDFRQEILSVISKTKECLNENKDKAFRFIVSEDLMNMVGDAFGDFQLKILPVAEDNYGEKAYCLWVFASPENETKIDEAESFFTNSGKNDKLVNELTGILDYRKNSTKSIIENLKGIKSKYNLKDIYIVGETARELIFSDNITTNNVSFISENKMDTIKYAQILSKAIGCKFTYTKNGDICCYYNDMVLKFHCGSIHNKSEFINEIMKDSSYCDNKTPLSLEILNRDFTINMLAYNVINEEITSPYTPEVFSGKILETRFDPNKVISENPIIIIRALLLCKQGYCLSHELEDAIFNNLHRISDLPEEYKNLAKKYLKEEGI